jgi:hypothetical protein
VTSQSFNLTQQQQISSAAVIAAAGPASNTHQQHPQTSHIQVYEQSSNTFDASSVNRPETENVRSET